MGFQIKKNMLRNQDAGAGDQLWGPKFKFEIQTWKSLLKIKLEIQTWKPNLKFKLEIQTWNSNLKFHFCLEIKMQIIVVY